jgi:NADP-dependent 3-hydroxy acid dehydrogenase YdfG
MLTSGRLAAAIVWAISQPPGVDVNTLTIRPVGAPIA